MKKTILLFIASAIILTANAQTKRAINIHNITPITIVGQVDSTISINAALSLQDSSIHIFISFLQLNNMGKQLIYPITHFQPFTSYSALKIKVVATIEMALGITITN